MSTGAFYSFIVAVIGVLSFFVLYILRSSDLKRLKERFDCLDSIYKIHKENHEEMVQKYRALLKEKNDLNLENINLRCERDNLVISNSILVKDAGTYKEEVMRYRGTEFGKVYDDLRIRYNTLRGVCKELQRKIRSDAYSKVTISGAYSMDVVDRDELENIPEEK